MTDKKQPTPPTANISIWWLLLDIIGMALVVFAGYEIYLINEKNTGILAEHISWPHYPWVIMVIGVLCMIPFHKQVFSLFRKVKQYQKDLAKKDRPDF
ncbi:hypothetical protein [Kangiella shandongensis]|uniref:hypothetical protein n=1 Tax=Kangiella shandongensis TaxID=2763258 RepID=UPI001CBBC359|nr:hypothetical protein [Kangiella shandongensis]